MRVSHYIPKLAFDNVRKKKSRTFLSFISVMLSSSIIFVSLTLFATVFTLSKSLNTKEVGSAHYHLISDHFDIIDPFQYQVSVLSLDSKDGIAYFEQNEQASFFYLEEGEMPLQENEILVPAGSEMKIGDAYEGYRITGIYQPTSFFKNLFEEMPVLSIDAALKTSEMHYFVHDNRVHDTASLKAVSQSAGKTTADITLNESRITNDIIANYLQDTSTILGMFIIIIVIAGIMCLVSIYNVLIVNDQDRRKEIGLLKSIGITSKELKLMLVLELTIIGLVGGIVGVLIGSGISALVLHSVLAKLKTTLSTAMIFRSWVILVSVVSGILLMVCSGYCLYHKYFRSNPISDLKGEPVEYDIPYNSDRFAIDSVTWRMFVIYNERIKKQTRNLRRSFFLVMLTITLFCGIWFSNFLYQKSYNSVNADIAIEQAVFSLGDKRLYPELDEKIYEAEQSENMMFSSLLIDRSVIGVNFLTPMDTFTETYMSIEKENVRSKEVNGVKWNTAYHNGVVLDKHQLAELADYVVSGSLDDMDEHSVILIYYQQGYYTTKESMRTHEAGFPVLCQTISSNQPYPDQYLNADVIIELPFEKMNLKYSEVDQYLYTIALTPESFATLQSPSLTLSYNARLKLNNAAEHQEVSDYLQRALSEISLAADLKLTDYIQLKTDGQFAVFMIETLLYPLFFMLVIIGVINLNNVLKGNIHMKRVDFSTMKSVGMTHEQLRMTMLYEYVENYINAGAITFLLCIPVYILEHFFSIASTFRVGDNFTGMFVMSFAILSPLLIFSLAILSFRHLKEITALDGMKDVT